MKTLGETEKGKIVKIENIILNKRNKGRKVERIHNKRKKKAERKTKQKWKRNKKFITGTVMVT
jgi:hypothetical protein